MGQAAIGSTSVIAALFALLYVGLSVRVIRLRRATRIPIGASGSDALERAIRVHGNFAEYVPFTLVLLLLLDLQRAPWPVVPLLGVLLLAGRCLHAFGVSRANEDYRFRVTGMALTFGTIITAALGLIWLSLRGH